MYKFNKKMNLLRDISAIILIVSHLCKTCTGVDTSKHYFGTKNTYSSGKEYLKKERIDVERNIQRFHKEIHMDGCQPVHLNGLLRHGIRNPGHRDLQKVEDFFAKLKEFIQDNGKSKTDFATKMYKTMNAWSAKDMFANAKTTDKELTSSGYWEMFGIGQRIAKQFPSLVNNGKSVRFISSKTHRALNSCRACQEGLNLVDFDFECYIDNAMLRFFDKCPEYIETMQNETNLKEPELFKIGPEVDSIIQKFQRNLAVHETPGAKPLDIEYGDLKALYSVSACEVAIHNTSLLVTLFDDTDLHVMEYAADMRSYWKRAYGHVINYKQACVLFTHIITTIEDVVYNKKGHDKTVLRFGHAETLLPVISLLGLYKDQSPLSAHRYPKLNKRLFKTGQIMSFSANIMFVLYKCERNITPFEFGNIKIVLLHNEVPVYLPPCPEQYLCSYNTFKQYYRHVTSECDFNEICNIKSRDEL